MQRYKIEKKLGEGGFGTALLAKDNTDGKLVVIKSIPTTKKSELSEAKAEAELLKKLDHPNIISYIASFNDGGKFCIVMNYANGGDLYQRIQKRKRHWKYLNTDQVMNVFVQICLALKHCHDRHILHRDLKSQNVFLTKKGRVKLGDFGIAKSLDSTMALAKTQIGTPYYLSPEICKDRPYNQKSDIWALGLSTMTSRYGILLYEMCALRLPFEAKDMPALIRKIMSARYARLGHKWAESMRRLVSLMLQKESRRRPSITKLLENRLIQKYLQKSLDATMQKNEMPGKTGTENQTVGKRKPPLRPARQAKPMRPRAVDQPKVKASNAIAATRKVSEMDATRKVAKPPRKPVRKKPVPRQQPARRRESAPPEEAAQAKRAQKEKAAQRAEVDALRKKWQQERENFLANAGGKIAKQNARPAFQVEQPRQNPVQVEVPKQYHAVEEHDMNTYERALKEARVQAFQDRRDMQDKYGNGKNASSFDGFGRPNNAPVSKPPARNMNWGDPVAHHQIQRKSSQKEQQEQNYLDMLKQARIQAFQERQRIKQIHAGAGGRPTHARPSSREDRRPSAVEDRGNRPPEDFRQHVRSTKQDEEDAKLQALKEARIQAFAERQRLMARHGESNRPASASNRPGSSSSVPPSRDAHSYADKSEDVHEAHEAANRPLSKQEKEDEQLRLLKQARIDAFAERQRLMQRHAASNRPASASSARPTSASSARAAETRKLRRAESFEGTVRPTKQDEEDARLQLLKEARIQAFAERQRLMARHGESNRPASASNRPEPTSSAPSYSDKSEDVYEARKAVNRPLSKQEKEDEKLRLLKQARIDAFAERQRLMQRHAASNRPASASSARPPPAVPPPETEREGISALPRGEPDEEALQFTVQKVQKNQAGQEEEKLRLLKQARIEAFAERQRLMERAKMSEPLNADAETPSVADGGAVTPRRAPVDPAFQRGGLKRTPACGSDKEVSESQVQPTVETSKQEDDETEKLRLLREARIEAFKERQRLMERAKMSEPLSTDVETSSAVDGGAVTPRRAPVDAAFQRGGLQRTPASGSGEEALKFEVQKVQKTQAEQEEDKLRLLKQARIEAFAERQRLMERAKMSEPLNADVETPSAVDDGAVTPRRAPVDPAFQRGGLKRTPAGEAMDSQSKAEDNGNDKLRLLEQARIEAFAERQRLMARAKMSEPLNTDAPVVNTKSPRVLTLQEAAAARKAKGRSPRHMHNDILKHLQTEVETKPDQKRLKEVQDQEDLKRRSVAAAAARTEEDPGSPGEKQRYKLIEAGKAVLSPGKTQPARNLCDDEDIEVTVEARRTRLQNIIGMAVGALDFVGAPSDDAIEDENAEEQDEGAEDQDEGAEDQDEDNVDSWLIDADSDEQKEDGEDNVTADDDDSAELISHLQKALEVTRRTNSENSDPVDNEDETPADATEPVPLEELDSEEETALPPAPAPSETHATEQLPAVATANDATEQTPVVARARPSQEPTFEFTTPPPTATGPDAADELREYLETHLGMKPLLTFYRFARRNSIDDAINRAMDIYKDGDDNSVQFRKLLYRLAKMELT